MKISDILIDWYNKNKRDLPWRNTNDPYLIWLSEIMLQQTRVAQGINYYRIFSKEFPNVYALANADLDIILKLWQGLGYYSRARNMHKTAQYIITNSKGEFPNDYKKLINLKGIGEYTAAAILSFAFNQPYAVLDGNVYRVVARIFGIKKAINVNSNKIEFKKIAEGLLNHKKPGIHNQSIMEFGALQCIPKNPNCNKCPLNNICYAFKNNYIHKLPVKEKRIKIKKRYFNYLVFSFDNNIIIKKRINNDIWKNLYDFPLIETKQEINPEKLLQSEGFRQLVNTTKKIKLKISRTHIHKLTHQKIFAKFYFIQTKKTVIKGIKQYIQIKHTNIVKYAVPKLIENYLEEELLKNNIMQ